MSAWDLGGHSPGWSSSPAAPTRGRLNLWLITEPINRAARGMEDAGGLCRRACGAGHKSPAREGRHLQEGWGPEEGRYQTGASWGPEPLTKSGSGPGCSGVLCKVTVPHRAGFLVQELCGSA